MTALKFVDFMGTMIDLASSHCRRLSFRTQALAVEMSPNTRVNSIAPGFVPTHFANFITSNEDTVSFSISLFSPFLSPLLI